MNAKVLKHAFRIESPPQPALLGDSPATAELRRVVARAGPTDAGVLITGESGAGKEFVARLIHASSPRSQGPFVRLNCDVLPPGEIEAGLFGSEQTDVDGIRRVHAGALERAAGGSLFLDEIAGMPPQTQGRLLNAMDTGRYHRIGGSTEISPDVRIIAASTRCPMQLARQGLLREDILYSLAVFLVQVPALRERGADVIVLAEHFLEEMNAREARDKRFSARSRDLMMTNEWPGNARELRSCIARAFALCDDLIELSPLIARHDAGHDPGRLEIRVGSSIDQAERSLIEATLQHFHGNKRRAADTLGCSLKTLYNKLHAYARNESHVAGG